MHRIMWPFFDQDVFDAVERLTVLVRSIKKELATMSMTNQEHADAVAAQLADIDVAVKSGTEAILAEIAALKQNNPSVDFSGVDAAITQLGTDVAAVTAIPSNTETP